MRGCRKEYKREYNREWRKANPEYHREYRKDNAEKRAQAQRDYRKKNPEVSREWRKANRDALNKAARDRSKTPEARAKKNARVQARKARKLAQTPWMNQAEYAELEAMYLYNAIMPGNWHVDHIQPLSKDGLHHPTNLQLMRGEENVRKNARWDCCDQAKAAESTIQGELSLLLDNAQRFTQLPLAR